jgi:hypothetical protein
MASFIPDAQVSPAITFETPVTTEAYQPEWIERKIIFNAIKSQDIRWKSSVFRATSFFSHLKTAQAAGRLTAEAVSNYAIQSGATEFTVLNMQADQSEGFKLKYVKEVAAGKPVFTDNAAEALKVDGVFIFPEGVVIRLFNGFVPAQKKMMTQTTVELLNFTTLPEFITQDWVTANMRGLSSYAFKVNENGVCPAGTWAQYGVNPDDKATLNSIMESCHLLVN